MSCCVVAKLRHSRAVLSRDAVSTRAPSAENTALHTASSWPRRMARSLPLAASHSRAVLSRDAVSTCVPSGEELRAPHRVLMAAQEGRSLQELADMDPQPIQHLASRAKSALVGPLYRW